MNRENLCGSVRQCDCVSGASTVQAAVCGCAKGSVRAVRAAVCGSVLGSVWQCAWQCAAVRMAVCGSACALHSIYTQSRSRCIGIPLY
jgi:hypothetical protein